MQHSHMCVPYSFFCCLFLTANNQKVFTLGYLAVMCSQDHYFSKWDVRRYSFTKKPPPPENTRILRSFSCFPGPWPLFGIFEKIGANLHSTKGVILHGREGFFSPLVFWPSGPPERPVSGGGSRGSSAWVGTVARLGRDREVWRRKNSDQN